MFTKPGLHVDFKIMKLKKQTKRQSLLSQLTKNTRKKTEKK